MRHGQPVGLRRVAMVGAIGLHVGTYGATPEHELLVPVLAEVLRCARLSHRDVDGMVFTHPRPYCRQRYFSTHIQSYLRTPMSFVLEVVGNGMTGGQAFRQAADAVASGRVDVCVVLGVSRESHVPTAEHMAETSSKAVGDVDFHTPFGINPLTWLALAAQRYLVDHGGSTEMFAEVAVKNRRHAALNPLAHLVDPLTRADVLGSRLIADPLRLLDCPPRDDGAVAIVLVPEERAREFTDRPVLLRGYGEYHSGTHMLNDRPGNLLAFPAIEHASSAAYAMAGVTAADIDVAEIYAPTTNMELIVAEGLGLFPKGRAGAATLAGETALDGRVPICPSGGCQSRGHPPLVTPLYNIVEVFQQLRGEAGRRQVPNARLALTTSELGLMDAILVEIFESGD